MKRIISFLFVALVLAALCAAQATPVSGSFRQDGIASWYGSEFDGRLTASGEIFKSSLFTAAHPSLPFGTLLLVTNAHNYKQVVVRVNDRGPFVPARIIDLSRAAAERLDMIVTGTAPVIVEVTNMPAGYFGQASVPPAPVPPPAPLTQYIPVPVPQPEPVLAPLVPAYRPPEAPRLAAEIKPAIPVPGSGKLYRIQVGAYKIARNALEAFDKLKGTGLNPAYEKNGDMYRVVLAGLRPEEIPLVAERLGAAGFREALIREEL